MSDFLEFNEADIKRGTILPSDWYVFNVTNYRSEVSKAGDSTNFVFEFISKSSSEKFNGVPVTHRFNTKSKGYIRPFLEACGATVEAGKQYDLNDCVGKAVRSFVRVGEYNGNPKNELTQFQKAA